MSSPFIRFVTDLKNYPLLSTHNGTSVSIDGYSSINDGGGGHFYWDSTSTEADNNGTIIAPTGVSQGRWKRQDKLKVDVRAFGAKGDWRVLSNCAINSGARTATISGLTSADIGKRLTIKDAGPIDSLNFPRAFQSVITNVVGTTITLSNSFPAAISTVSGKAGSVFSDDMPSFNNAVAYLNSLGGGELFVPPGIYGFTNAINISSELGFVGNITIRGAGKNAVLQVIDGGWDADFAHDGQHFGLVNIYNVNNCRITNICLSGSGDVAADFTMVDTLVYFASAGDCMVDHCWIQNTFGAAIFGSRTSADTQARLMQRMNIRDNIFNNCVFPGPKTGLVAGNTIEAAGQLHVIQNNTFTHCASPVNMAGDHCLIDGNSIDDFIGIALTAGDSFSVEGNCIRNNSIKGVLDSTMHFDNVKFPLLAGIVIQPPLGQGLPAIISDNSIHIEIKDGYMLNNRGLIGCEWEVADVIFSNNLVQFKFSTNITLPAKLVGFATSSELPQVSRLENNEVRFYTENGSTWSGNIGGYQIEPFSDGYWTILSSNNRCTGVGSTSGVFSFGYSVGGTANLKIQCRGDIFDSGGCTIGNAIASPNRPMYIGYDSTLSTGIDSPMALGIPVFHSDTDADAVLMRRSVGGDVIRGSVKDAHIDANATIQGTKISPSFGTQNVITTGTATFGGNSDQNQLTIKGFAGQSADLIRFKDSSSNILIRLTADGSNLSFGGGVVNPVISQLGNGVGDGGTVSYRGQDGGGANGAGGTVVLGGGVRTGAGLRGGFRIGNNGGSEAMIEGQELVANQRVLSLLTGNPIDISRTPVGSGDRVMFIAEAAVVPTVDPAGGIFVYVDPVHGDLALRGPSGGGNISWNKGSISPKIYQLDNTTNNATAQSLTLQGQNATGTNTTGAALNITSGTGTSLDGYVNIQTGGKTVATAAGTFFSIAKSRRLRVDSVVQSYIITGVDGYNVIAVGAIAAGITITLPGNPTLGDTYAIIDSTGIAATNNITIAGNGKNINNNSSALINQNYESMMLLYSGVQWNLI